MDKILNEIQDLKVEQLKSEVKFDRKLNEVLEIVKSLKDKIEKR